MAISTADFTEDEGNAGVGHWVLIEGGKTGSPVVHEPLAQEKHHMGDVAFREPVCGTDADLRRTTLDGFERLNPHVALTWCSVCDDADPVADGGTVQTARGGTGAVSTSLGGHLIIDSTTGRIDVSPELAVGASVAMLVTGAVIGWALS